MAMENESGGFSYDDAGNAIKGDSFKQPCAMEIRRTFRPVVEKQYMLRVHLNNATVYAITVRERPIAGC